MSTETITIRLSPDEIARVDEMRGEGVSRSAFVRELLRRSGPLEEEPTYPEALVLLARSARAGKVQAQGGSGAGLARRRVGGRRRLA